MFSYQDEQVQKISDELKKSQLVIDGSKTGTGKTHVGIKVAKKMNSEVLVICLKNVISFWREVSNLNGVKVEIKNYASLKTFMDIKVNIPSSTFIIIDEIHSCINDTLNRKLLNYFLTNGNKILGLSATIDLPYPTFRMDVKMKYNNNIHYPEDILPSQTPPKTFNFTHVRQLEKRKIPLYLEKFEMLKDYPVIMFANYNNTINELEKLLKDYNPLVVNGTRPEQTNKKNITEFKNNGGLLIINSKIGGSSINLQTKINKPTKVIMNLVWSPILFNQMLGRAYRVDNVNNVDQYILVSKELLDRYMYYVLINKKQF